jgi:hypothetical protein
MLLWSNGIQSGEARLVRANWLIESLYVDYPGICTAVGINKSLESECQLVAMTAAMLMMLNIESADSDERDEGGYNAWI